MPSLQGLLIYSLAGLISNRHHPTKVSTIDISILSEDCTCNIYRKGWLPAWIGSPDEVDAFTVTGIDFDRFATSRAIAGLVGELKEEMKTRQVSIQERLQA